MRLLRQIDTGLRTLKQNIAANVWQQPGNSPQKGRLARAIWARHNHGFAAIERKADIFQDMASAAVDAQSFHAQAQRLL